MLDKVVKDFPELLPTIQEEGRNKITFSLITDLRDFEAVAKSHQAARRVYEQHSLALELPYDQALQSTLILPAAVLLKFCKLLCFIFC